MWEACPQPFELEPYLWSYLWTSPLIVSLGLILFGGVLAALWIKLRRWWRLIPVALGLSVAGLILFQPVQHQLKLWSATDMVETGEWKSSGKFILRDIPSQVEAYQVGPELPGCRLGFIVHSSNPHFESSHRSWRGYLATGVAQFGYGDDYSLCVSRVLARNWGAASQDEGAHSQCHRPLPKLEFFDASHDGSPGFEMTWCAELDSDHYYCEAHSQSVALAQGYHF